MVLFDLTPRGLFTKMINRKATALRGGRTTKRRQSVTASRVVNLMRWAARNGLRKSPFWAFIVATRQCHQHCSHCYEWQNDVPHMAEVVHRGIIEKLREIGVVFVSYYGGEPTLNQELPAFIRYAKSRGLGAYVNTDLTACPTDERLVEVVKAGVDIISFSLDGITATKGNLRIVGAVDTRLDLLRRMRKQGYSFGLHSNVTLHKGNLAEAQGIVEYLLGLGDVGISIRPALYPIPYPEVTQKARSLLLDSKDIPEIRRLTSWALRLKRQGRPIIVPDGYLADFEKFLVGGHRWDCGAQRDILFVDWDGTLLTCSYFTKQKPPAPLVQLDMTYCDLTPKHWQTVKPVVGQTLEQCNSRCFTSAYWCTAYYRRHPVNALLSYLKI